MRTDMLNTFEQETLNRFLLHHMGMETRRKLMAEYPVIYRKLLGKEDEEPFREAVRRTVLENRRVYTAPDALVKLAESMGEDGTGLPLAPPGVGKMGALQVALSQLEEDE